MLLAYFYVVAVLGEYTEELAKTRVASFPLGKIISYSSVFMWWTEYKQNGNKRN